MVPFFLSLVRLLTLNPKHQTLESRCCFTSGSELRNPQDEHPADDPKMTTDYYGV